MRKYNMYTKCMCKIDTSTALDPIFTFKSEIIMAFYSTRFVTSFQIGYISRSNLATFKKIPFNFTFIILYGYTVK